MACVCGHSIEEHRKERHECAAEISDSAGIEEPCGCLMYEADEDDDE